MVACRRSSWPPSGTKLADPPSAGTVVEYPSTSAMLLLVNWGSPVAVGPSATPIESPCLMGRDARWLRMLSRVPPGTAGAVLLPADVNVFPPVGRRMRSVYTAPMSPVRTAHAVTVPFAGEVKGWGEVPPAWPSCTPRQFVQIEGVLGWVKALPIVAVFPEADAATESRPVA